ncbi:MAG TPA: hypothetical protein VM368_05130, partial [Flavisolibacter sp.]|nr:hypothetical protein [Flavisolibacter sp.]
QDLSASLEASISGGDIDVAIKELGKYMRIHNTGGDIDLQLPDNNGPDLRLSGRKIKVPALANFSGNIDDEQIEGKLNDGGVPENVRAGSGRIYLSMK